MTDIRYLVCPHCHKVNRVPASQFGIRSIPTLILFQNGREVARQSGAMNLAQISH